MKENNNREGVRFCVCTLTLDMCMYHGPMKNKDSSLVYYERADTVNLKLTFNASDCYSYKSINIIIDIQFSFNRS